MRGINVGGNNIVPMAELRRSLSAEGFGDVKTYIQSGNVIFNRSGSERAAHARDMQALVTEQFGCSPEIVVLSANEAMDIRDGHPFAGKIDNPSRLQLFFLLQEPTVTDVDKLESLKSPTEQYALQKHVFYLHAPDGVGRSKLAANVDRCLGVATTARNLRTVSKVLQLCNE